MAVGVGQECPVCGAAQPGRRPALRLRDDQVQLEFAGDGPWTIGRGAPDTPQLADRPTVSWLHARVSREGDAFVVADLKSTNGTYIDGHRVGNGQTAPLRPGARLGLGQSVELHVHSPA
jgi:pSer/pThr/pTyr-binding forkhead associated (FHA) protein